MTYTRPQIGNLRKRAKALGMVITKATTNEDAYMFGAHQYVLHTPEQDWENMHSFTLDGIRYEIIDRERKANA